MKYCLILRLRHETPRKVDFDKQAEREIWHRSKSVLVLISDVKFPLAGQYFYVRIVLWPDVGAPSSLGKQSLSPCAS